MMPEPPPVFSLHGRVAVITGGAGLLGVQHARAVALAGGTPVLADIRGADAVARAAELADEFGTAVTGLECDVTRVDSVQAACAQVVATYGHVDILVNNAARNPKVEDPGAAFSRLEQFSLDQWNADLAVGLTGAFLCAKVFGSEMARQRHGVIINISSEYGIIAPDQRLYYQPGAPSQPVKPVTYSVVKSGLHGLTLYLATYWAAVGVRANTISLGGVSNGQPDVFIERAVSRIPLGRMAAPTDFQGALVFLCSEAASFVTGANVVVDGGKTIW